MLNEPNEERISRKAASLRWTGDNTQAVMDRLAQHGMIGELYRDIYIQVYKDGSYSTTVNVGSWLVEGEDGKLRFYTDDQHKLMYRPISDELERYKAFVSDVYDIEMDQKVVKSIIDLIRKHGLFPVSMKAHE